MTISYITASAIASTASGTGVTPTVPTGAAHNNVFVAVCTLLSNATVSTPSGWSRLTQNNGTGIGTAYFAAVYTGSLANPAFTWTGAVAAAAIIYEFTGNVTAGSLFDNNSFNHGTANPHTNPGFTSAGLQSISLAFDSQASSTAQATTPGGWTLASALGDATSGISMALWSLQLGAVGSASGSISVTETSVAWTLSQIGFLADQLQSQACL